MAKGDDVLCTFTNSRQRGSIELKKTWGRASSKTTLQIGTSAGGTQTASQQTGPTAQRRSAPAPRRSTPAPTTSPRWAGSPTMTSSLACFNDNGAGGGTADNGIKDGGEASVTPDADKGVAVAKGDDVLCTFTNSRQRGSIELKKTWVGTGGQTTLQIGTSAGGTQTASQQTGADGAAPLSTGAKAVDTGTYYVSEAGGLDQL